MFAVGSPTTLVSPAVRGESVVVALERDARAETTALVTSNSVEIWRGTRRVGGFWRSPATVSSEGAFLCAKWRENRNTLAVVAEGGRVYLYHLQFIENPELVLGVPAVRCDITKRATLRLATPRRAPAGPPPNAATPFPNTSFAPPPLSPVIEDAAAANDGTCVCVTGDTDTLLVGTSTGHFVQFDWDHKDVPNESDVNKSSFKLSLGNKNETRTSSATSKTTKGSGVLSRGDQLAFAGSVVDIDFCALGGVVAAVAGFGDETRTAVLRLENARLGYSTAKTAQVPPLVAERLGSPRWCPGSEGATCARLAPAHGISKSTLAVGTKRGDVLLYCTEPPVMNTYDCSPESSPKSVAGSTVWSHDAQPTSTTVKQYTKQYSVPTLLRVLRITDWGYAPTETGGVWCVRWTVDGAALAVAWQRRGLSVWSPGGCRLMCTLGTPGGGLCDAGNSRLRRNKETDPRATPGGSDSASDEDTFDGDKSSRASRFRAFVKSDDCDATEKGAEQLAWTNGGRSLFAAANAKGEQGSASRLLMYDFANSVPSRFVDVGGLRTGDGSCMGDGSRMGKQSDVRGQYCSSGSKIMASRDGLLVFDGHDGFGNDGFETSTYPTPRQIQLPSEYHQANGAPAVVCVSDNKKDALVAGKKGFVLLDLPTEAFRVFGDVSQEKAFRAIAGAWVGDVVVVAVALDDGCTTNNALRRNESVDGFKSTNSTNGWFDWFGLSTVQDVTDDVSEPNTERNEKYALRLYPKYHLDASSVLLDVSLPSAPVAVHACGDQHLLLALRNKNKKVTVIVYRVAVTGAPRVGSGAAATLTETRRTVVSAPGVLDVVPVPAMPRVATGVDTVGSDSLGVDLALVHRAGGSLSLLDLRSGIGTSNGSGIASKTRSVWANSQSESHSSTNSRVLASRGVERFWVTAGARPCGTPESAEYSWWTSGGEGIRVFYLPRLKETAETAEIKPAFGEHDPETRFDNETFVTGIFLGDETAPVIQGIAQRVVRSTEGTSTTRSTDGTKTTEDKKKGGELGSQKSFAPHFATQPVLPSVLRYLLAINEKETARDAAVFFSKEPPFTHALEWLVFSALDNVCGPDSRDDLKDENGNGNGNGNDTARRDEDKKNASVCLSDTLALVRHFAQYVDVVAAVARKTDAAFWPVLFREAGDPLELLQCAMHNGRLRVAGCYLLVVDALCGPEALEKATADLVMEALVTNEYVLVGELCRFAARPAVEAAAKSLKRNSGNGFKHGDKTTSAVSSTATNQAGETTSYIGGLLRWVVGGETNGNGNETQRTRDSDSPKSSHSPKAPEYSPNTEHGSGHDEHAATLHTPRGMRSVPGARGGILPVLPTVIRLAIREHARCLARNVDLGNLSALCRLIDFDARAFFADESASAQNGGAARLGDFPKALALASESMKRHDNPPGGGSNPAWAGVGHFLEQTVKGGSLCAEWTLVTATLLRRKDALRAVFAGRVEIEEAWERGVLSCADAARERNDSQTSAFLTEFLEEVRGKKGPV